MNAALSAEWLKLRTTRTTLGLLVVLLGLVTLATLLHGLGLKAASLDRADQQLRILADAGESLGAVFAALAGALAITGEFRHGTIRPTLLAAPRRTTLIAAKAVTSMATGVAYGLIASGTAVASVAIALSARSPATRSPPSSGCSCGC